MPRPTDPTDMDGWITRRALLAAASGGVAATAAGCSTRDPATVTETRLEAPVFTDDVVDASASDADCVFGTPDGYVEFRYRDGPAVDTEQLYIVADAGDETTRQLANCAGVGAEIVEGDAVVVGAPGGVSMTLLWTAGSGEKWVLSEVIVSERSGDEDAAASVVDA
jgi:hypothetical protein